MDRREIGVLLLILCGGVAFVGLYPTVPRGDIPAPHVADWSVASDDPTRTIELSWDGPAVAPTAKKGTWIETNLEKIFHVRFSPIFMDWNSYLNRRPLMFSSGDVPDVCWDGDPLPLRRSIQHGLVLEIPYQVILKYAPTYVKNLNTFGKEAWLYSLYKGRNYGIPTWAANGTYPAAGMWRMDWLRQVGIDKVPDTIDEMHDAFVKIRDGAPGRAGRGSVYGICPINQWSKCFVDIFAPFKILPAEFVLRDGKIVWGGVQPDVRHVLEILHQWYTEGLIDPDFTSGTAGTNLTEEKFLNGKSAYMFEYKTWIDLDLSNPISFYSKMRQINPRVELELSPPLRGPDGHRRGRTWGGGGHIIWFGPQVARHPQKVIRVLQMFEAFTVSRELFLESRLGKRGVHWDWSADRGVYLLEPYDQPGADKRNLIDLRSVSTCFGFYSCSAAPPEFTDDLFRPGTRQANLRYSNPKWGIQNVFGKSDVVESAGDYLQDLREYQTTAFAQFIRGDRPLSQFDDFVREWNSRGGAQLTREANEMHTEMRRIFSIVGAQDAPEAQ